MQGAGRHATRASMVRETLLLVLLLDALSGEELGEERNRRRFLSVDTQMGAPRAKMSFDDLVLTRQGVFGLIILVSCVNFLDGCPSNMSVDGLI